MRIQRGHVKAIPVNGKPAVNHAATDIHPVRQASLVVPEPAAGPRINGPGVIVRSCQVQDSIDHNGSGFEFSENTSLKMPTALSTDGRWRG